MSEVYFFDYAKGENVLRGLDVLFQKSRLAEAIPRGGSVAIKLHMGELGNITYIRPIFATRVADLVKRAGGKPFVTDTTTLYQAERGTPEKYLATAAANGFVEQSIGAPIVIADEGNGGISVPLESRVEGCHLEAAKVAPRIYHADSLVVLSHFKGHDLTGFGGAIKNLGMGCVTKETKRAQHAVNAPVLDESLCDGCGNCVDVCRAQALTLVEGKPVRNEEACINCSDCLFNCPTGALRWPEGAKERLQVYLAHVASAVLKNFRGRVGFINFVQDVTPHCDCASPSGRPIVQDVGILASSDPVAIDKASLDLVDRAPVILSSLSASPPDLLGKMHHTDSLVQLRTGQKLGLGNLEYRLITL